MVENQSHAAQVIEWTIKRISLSGRWLIRREKEIERFAAFKGFSYYSLNCGGSQATCKDRP